MLKQLHGPRWRSPIAFTAINHRPRGRTNNEKLRNTTGKSNFRKDP
jgi:hypothetical protein